MIHKTTTMIVEKKNSNNTEQSHCFLLCCTDVYVAQRKILFLIVIYSVDFVMQPERFHLSECNINSPKHVKNWDFFFYLVVLVIFAAFPTI